MVDVIDEGVCHVRWVCGGEETDAELWVIGRFLADYWAPSSLILAVLASLFSLK